MQATSTKDIIVQSANGPKKISKAFTFDAAFDGNTSQEELFSAVGAPVVEEVLKGFNCTIFAYGQTGTGKTFTMEGLKDGSSNDPHRRGAGVIPRAVEQIFAHVDSSSAECHVRVSCLELYNEELTDLISLDGNKVKMLEDPRKGVNLIGAEDRTVSSANDIYTILDQCQARRRTAETMLNQQSRWCSPRLTSTPQPLTLNLHHPHCHEGDHT